MNEATDLIETSIINALELLAKQTLIKETDDTIPYLKFIAKYLDAESISLTECRVTFHLMPSLGEDFTRSLIERAVTVALSHIERPSAILIVKVRQGPRTRDIDYHMVGRMYHLVLKYFKVSNGLDTNIIEFQFPDELKQLLSTQIYYDRGGDVNGIESRTITTVCR